MQLPPPAKHRNQKRRRGVLRASIESGAFQRRRLVPLGGRIRTGGLLKPVLPPALSSAGATSATRRDTSSPGQIARGRRSSSATSGYRATLPLSSSCSSPCCRFPSPTERTKRQRDNRQKTPSPCSRPLQSPKPLRNRNPESAPNTSARASPSPPPRALLIICLPRSDPTAT